MDKLLLTGQGVKCIIHIEYALYTVVFFPISKIYIILFILITSLKSLVNIDLFTVELIIINLKLELLKASNLSTTVRHASCFTEEEDTEDWRTIERVKDDDDPFFFIALQTLIDINHYLVTILITRHTLHNVYH